MAQDSFTRLKDAARLVSGTDAAIPYSVIKARINEFNSAKTREEKNEIIKKIEADIKAIRDQRASQKEKKPNRDDE